MLTGLAKGRLRRFMRVRGGSKKIMDAVAFCSRLVYDKKYCYLFNRMMRGLFSGCAFVRKGIDGVGSTQTLCFRGGGCTGDGACS